MLLPRQQGAHPSLLVGCGKEGTIYLIDRQNMGKYNGPNGPDHVVQSLPGAVGGIWGGPAYYHGPSGQFVYYCGKQDPLKAFELANDRLSPAGQSGQALQGGAIPAVSSHGGVAGTGIVWLINRTNPLALFAFDATNLTAKLFEGNAGSWGNPHGGAFLVPTVINGKVYVGTGDQLAVFGLH